jgi:ABC-2 type transport system ATP-binding protein
LADEGAIDVRDLHKSRGPNQAVRGVSFQVRAGEVFSLLGPNGAGKSTTLAMLSGLLKPDRGDAFLAGHSIRDAAAAARRALGVVPQEVALYPDLSALENLHFWGRMYGLGGALLRERSQEMLELTGLTHRKSERVATFSGGMQRRLNIGVALLHRPSIVIMDEPTVGIDPQSRRHILDGIRALQERGTTILYTTHFIEEAAELSQHIAIMDQGRIIASGTHRELLGLLQSEARIELAATGVTPGVLQAWRDASGAEPAPGPDGTVTFACSDSQRVLPRLFEAALREGAHITRVDVHEPDLEAVFLHLTGKALRD